MDFFTQTTTVHVWIIWLMGIAIALSIVQNVMKIIEEHHAKKLERSKR